MRLNRQLKGIVEALEDIKGRDIVVLDVRKMTSLFDWLVIATADSSRQSRALSSHLQEKAKALRMRARSIEGERAGDWVLIDLGSVVVHIMQPSVRQYYKLEELWSPPRATRRRADTARR